ncbi:cytochrome P450 CYP82D47-like [Cornus florida]|uniref:cytochrome P450 CYP82D47-like n=1 Tax=Cornus florida TaxID=4283 RepID=UPI002896424A|nr:cytochrome P450 CYP82D47-like [Cornus florida]
MDPLLLYLITLASGLLALLVFVYRKKQSTCTRKSCGVPQAGGALPIIGHLHLLVGGQLTHKLFGALADKCGPAFTLRLGSHESLVISSWEMARECFTVHDKVFSTRPSISASKLLGYDFAMFGFAPYGPYWREMRKIATLELLSNRRIDMIKHTRASEVETSIRELYELWADKGGAKGGVLVDMKQWFGDLSNNTIVQMVGGKRYFGNSDECDKGERRRYKKVMRNFGYLFGVFVLSDEIPFLGWLDWGGYKKAMKSTAKELEALIGGWLEEHKQKRLLGEKGKGEQDFMDVMLNILEDAKISGFDTDTINKATCLNLILAGSDTTMVTLTWALALLLNNRHVLEKAQYELDTHVGKDRHVDESDIKDLVFLQAIVKETLRLYPTVPIIGLRAAMEACTLSSGYQVPAGTRLMVNAWKIHRDERVWSEPHEFRPERFLTKHKDVDVRGQNFELIPFGSGRRSCPGISLALQTVHLTLASLLHCHDIAKPSHKDVDMTESLGLTNLKATPLEVLLTPRLHSKLYGHSS